MTRDDRRPMTAPRHRGHQIHLWVSTPEYEWLKLAATETDETVSSLVRRVLRRHRLRLEAARESSESAR